MYRPNRTERQRDAATARLEMARRQALTRAIGAMIDAHQLPAAEILRRMLNEDAAEDGGKR
jgi:hypothetical protein